MNINNKLKLDIFNIALNEISLIEASAGTGKTFTIVMLYLRLLLGMRNSEKNSKKLRVHEILVVTFTNAAKEELYIRIKNGIQNLYLTCIDPKHKDPFFLCFLKEIKDIKEAIDILSKAQNEINNVSIYTIHSFCQNILQLYTFHFNIIFKEKIIEDENSLYLQATQDFWRHEFYNLPKNIIKIIYKDYKNPEFLLKKIKPFFNMQSINFLKNEKLLPYHEKNIKKIHSFKKIWLIYYSKISKIIYNVKINKNIYNQSNLDRWLNNITKWAHSKTQDYIIPMELKYFTKTNIKKNTLDDTYQSYILFEKIENLLKNNFSLKNIVLCHAIKQVNKILFKEKKNNFYWDLMTY